MKCTTILVEDLPAIVCGTLRRVSSDCCVAGCTHRATRLCDWRIGQGKGTCDALMCEEHTHCPSPGKDLCPAHATDWSKRQRPAVSAEKHP